MQRLSLIALYTGTVSASGSSRTLSATPAASASSAPAAMRAVFTRSPGQSGKTARFPTANGSTAATGKPGPTPCIT